MISNATKKDIIWGYSSQFLNIGVGILLIPVAIRFLSAEEMGLWYVFLALAGLAQLLEFGFQPTISRHTSFVYSGAVKLQAQGIPETNNNEVNLQLFVDLIYASKKIYKLVAFAATLVLMLLGSLYIYSLGVVDVRSYIAWVIFAMSSVINFYFSYFNGLLQGRGQQTLLNKTIAQSKVALLIFAVPMLFLGFGLLSLAIATFFSMVINRWLVSVRFYDKQLEDTAFIRSSPMSEDLHGMLFNSSWRLGLTSVGAFMIQKANLFIASSYLGLAVVGSYGLSLQLIGLLAGVSSIFFTLNMPKMTVLQTNSLKSELRLMFFKSLLVSILFFGVGAVSLLVIGSPLISFITSDVELVTPMLLALMLGFQLLETVHSLCATYLTTLNYVPFVKAAIFSGVLIVIFSLLGMNFVSTSLLVLILVQGLVQLSFNNWYWPLVTFRQLKVCQ